MISTFIATGKLNEFFLYQSNKKKTRMDHSILLPFNTGGQVYCGVDGSRGFARLSSSSSSSCRSSTAVGYWVNYYYFRYYTGHPEYTQQSATKTSSVRLTVRLYFIRCTVKPLFSAPSPSIPSSSSGRSHHFHFPFLLYKSWGWSTKALFTEGHPPLRRRLLPFIPLVIVMCWQVLVGFLQLLIRCTRRHFCGVYQHQQKNCRRGRLFSCLTQYNNNTKRIKGGQATMTLLPTTYVPSLPVATHRVLLCRWWWSSSSDSWGVCLSLLYEIGTSEFHQNNFLFMIATDFLLEHQ